MPEPDFEMIAVSLVLHAERGSASLGLIIAEQLRLAWNARGAADIAAIEALQLDVVVDHALRSLDR